MQCRKRQGCLGLQALGSQHSVSPAARISASRSADFPTPGSPRATMLAAVPCAHEEFGQAFALALTAD